MAVKRASVPAAKHPTARKPLTKAAGNRKSQARGDKMVCETCGLGVVVDAVSGLAVFEELICCGVPMKQKKASVAKKASAAKKPTAKK